MMTEMQLPIPDIRIWITVEGAAELLVVDPSTVRKWIKRGLLATHQPMMAIGQTGTSLLLVAEVERFAAARKVLGRG